MISKFIITNNRAETLTMELASPEESGFAVLGVEGLAGGEAGINLDPKVGGMDGSTFNSARVSERQVIFNLRYVGVDIESIRQSTYKYFPMKQLVNVKMFGSNRDTYIDGHVQSIEPNIFSPTSGCVVTLLCPDPLIYDVETKVVNFSSLTPSFTFPFSNESTTTPLLIMGEIGMEPIHDVVYDGDEDVGFILHIHATGPANNVSFISASTLDSISIDSTKLIALTGSDIVNGDDFYISTQKGNKYAILRRLGVEYNIRSCLGLNPAWLQLSKGSNRFVYSADSGITNIQFEITHSIAYWSP